MTALELLAQNPSLHAQFCAGVARDYGSSLLDGWHLQAQAGQWPPGGDWLIWLILAGRGYGKTRMGAEWVSQMAELVSQAPELCTRVLRVVNSAFYGLPGQVSSIMPSV